MANKKHLKILLQGVRAWNAWVETHGAMGPDLAGVDFSGAQLRQVNLTGANLAAANFSGADLSGAKLEGADLTHATFTLARLFNADLRGADLSGASFLNTDLGGANLENVNLSNAIIQHTSMDRAKVNNASLYHAHLSFVNLTDAEFGGTDFSISAIGSAVFAGSDLSKVKGLDSVWHLGPSEVSVGTIYRSNGNIPEVFLRGCGLPESFIAHIPALVASMQPIQFYSCFISYSSKDQKFAERLHADLQNKGVRCWYAPEDLKIGDRVRVGIDESIKVHDKLLLILSKNSIESEWVEKEVETAMERERQQKRAILFPIRLDDAVLKVESGWSADVRRSRNIGDFRWWKSLDSYQKAFDRLLRDLKADDTKP